MAERNAQMKSDTPGLDALIGGLTQEEPTARLRWIDRSFSDKFLPGKETVLQQEWRITHYTPLKELKFEWRDVPTVKEENPAEGDK